METGGNPAGSRPVFWKGGTGELVCYDGGHEPNRRKDAKQARRI